MSWQTVIGVRRVEEWWDPFFGLLPLKSVSAGDSSRFYGTVLLRFFCEVRDIQDVNLEETSNDLTHLSRSSVFIYR